MSTNQPQYIEKLRQTVQTGTLSPFIFNSFLEYQQQRRERKLGACPHHIATVQYRGTGTSKITFPYGLRPF